MTLVKAFTPWNNFIRLDMTKRYDKFEILSAQGLSPDPSTVPPHSQTHCFWWFEFSFETQTSHHQLEHHNTVQLDKIVVNAGCRYGAKD